MDKFSHKPQISSQLAKYISPHKTEIIDDRHLIRVHDCPHNKSFCYHFTGVKAASHP